MSYQVLARKWRPRTFQQMVGQEHVLRMLTNALDNQRLHHAYLFTGTRGVGKTTLARLLAKCLNCEVGISSNPCGQCNTCQSIDAGRFLDLIEVDGASRTKVEDTRELLDNVQYSPSQGRYKIYLIDEVHMLSGHSFNALLKTLEEPPAHVKFLLATTDPKRLPITILSRCLQFNLKRVPVEQIAKQLDHICQTENIPSETPALELLANAADGSMRDALSLLDQAIAYGSDKVNTDDTRQMLGSIEQDAIFRLLQALADHDGKKLIAEINHLAEQAPNFSHVLEELLATLHQISLTQIIQELPNKNAQIKQLANSFSAEEVQLYYQIALLGRRDLPLTPDATQGFEMTMMRILAFQPGTEQPSSIAMAPKAKAAPTPASPTSSSKATTPTAVAAPIPTSATSNAWHEILPKLELSGLAQAVASNCTLTNLNESRIELLLANSHASMLNTKLTDRIEQTLCSYFGKPMKLEIKTTASEIHTPAKQQQQEQATRHASATEAIKNDTHVQKMVSMFGATIDMSSIKSLDPTE